MIGARLRLELDDHEPAVITVRLADAFAAEDALGYDPLEAITAIAATGRPSLRMMRATAAVAWAAWTRTHDDGMTLEKFNGALAAMPVAVDADGNPLEADDDGPGVIRPTVAEPPSA